MDRREFMNSIVVGATAMHMPGLVDAARFKRGPAWLAETPLVLSGNHDSIPIFMRRRGGRLAKGGSATFPPSNLRFRSRLWCG